MPVYAPATFEQLAESVQPRVTTTAGLRELPGIGEARSETYGPGFPHLLNEVALPQPPAAVRADLHRPTRRPEARRHSATACCITREWSMPARCWAGNSTLAGAQGIAA